MLSDKNILDLLKDQREKLIKRFHGENSVKCDDVFYKIKGAAVNYYCEHGRDCIAARFVDVHWIDCDGFNDRCDERLAGAEYKTPGHDEPTEEDRNRWDYDTINDVRNDRESLKDLKDMTEIMTADGENPYMRSDYTLINITPGQTNGEPSWVDISDVIDLIDEALEKVAA